MHRYSWYLAITVWILWGIGVWLFVDMKVFLEGWPIAPTMLVGSFVAGSTSAGGGAVAFPVMTLLFGIQPVVARDFSLMIQSVGMTAAAIGIVLMRITVEWRAVLWANLGGLIGVAIGFQIADVAPPPITKMFFVSLWGSFGLALYLINRRGRDVVMNIHRYDGSKIFTLLIFGVIGGSVTGLTGSGLDILTFAILTLLFRLSETVATPTSVVIMAINSVIGVMLRAASEEGLILESVNYWWCAVPVVVVGAPLGAWFIKGRTRSFVTTILYTSIGLQFAGAWLLVPQDRATVLTSAIVLTVGCTFFLTVPRLSSKRDFANDAETIT